MTSLSIILMDVILLVFLLMLSIPLPVCFAGALLFLSLFGDVSMKTMLIWVFSQSTGTVLLASPLFILAGTYMGGSGIAKRLLDCVDAFVGHIKSGLGVVAVLVCAIMGAISGSGCRSGQCIRFFYFPPRLCSANILFCQYFVLPEFCTRYFPLFFPLCSGKIKFYLFIPTCYNEFIKDRRD